MTIINSNQINFKSFKPKKDIIQLIIFTIILIISAVFLKKHEQNKLKKYECTYAIISDKTKIYLGDFTIYYNYILKNKSYSYHNLMSVKKYNFLNKGDTILIKYSIEDNSVAEIVNYFWNDELRDKYITKKIIDK